MFRDNDCLDLYNLEAAECVKSLKHESKVALLHTWLVENCLDFQMKVLKYYISKFGSWSEVCLKILVQLRGKESSGKLLTDKI